MHGDRYQWAWSNWRRAWQSQPLFGVEAALGSSAREASVDVSVQLPPVLQLGVFVPKQRASSSLQS